MAAKTAGERIRERRIQLGITASELAERLGKDRSTICYYENGKVKDIPMKTINEIAGILDVSAAYLLGFDSNEKARPVAAGQGQGSKHDEILSSNGDSVKTTDWLTDFRVRRKMKGTEIVEAIRSLFPGFDKSLLSKVSSPEKYGVCLTPEAIRLLKSIDTNPSRVCDAISDDQQEIQRARADIDAGRAMILEGEKDDGTA